MAFWEKLKNFWLQKGLEENLFWPVVVGLVILIISGFFWLIKSWLFPKKPDNHTVNNYHGITLEQYEDGLKRREKEVRAELKQTYYALAQATKEKNDSERVRLTQQIQVLGAEQSAIESKLRNIQVAYQETLQKLKETEEQLTAFKDEFDPKEYQEAKVALEKGDLSKADVLYAQYLEKTEKAQKKRADAYYQRAIIAKQDFRYQDALNHVIEAADLDKQNFDYQMQAAEYARALGRYKKSLVYIERAEDIANLTDRQQVIIFAVKAIYYQNVGEYDKALPLYQKSLAITEENLGENHPETATSYNNLALLYQVMGEYDKALRLDQKSLAIREEILGENHPDTAISYNNLARLYQVMGEYDKALPLHQKSLTITEEILGENHPETAASYNNLAGLYEAMGEYDKALPLHQKSLVITEEILGENYPETAIFYNNLAGLYEAMAEYDKALPLYQKSIGILEKKLGKDHPHTKIVKGNLEYCIERMNK